MSKGNGVLKRIDNDLVDQIKKFADNNDISFRQASKEIAKLNRVKVQNRKIIKEIKF